MRTSHFHIHTTRETPADAEIISHQLMLRAGMIHKLTSGIYTWTPLGLKVLRNVETIVREEMDRSGALELLLPAIAPAELWQETGRWDQFGPLLLKIKDHTERDYCFGPTHEEVITNFARNEIKSYKQLPVNFYQIQTKFRDEIRPRFGVMRAREFLMKDAYSFHLDEASLREGYQIMYDAYTRIFSRLGLEFRAVQADSGAIGGSVSHEFHVLADSGEDQIAYSIQSNYAANVETAEALAITNDEKTTAEELIEFDTPNCKTIRELASLLKVTQDKLIKTLIIKTESNGFACMLLRGDHTLNTLKVAKLERVGEFTFAEEGEIRALLNCGPGSLGPVNMPLPIYVDRSAAVMHNFVCGANIDGKHFKHADWNRDVKNFHIVDIRNVVTGDPSPDGEGTLEIARGIEVGHVFQLGTKYSEAMHAVVLDNQGKAVPLHMGCYGIGVSRIVAAAIEQNHDNKGIIWPQPIAPFQVAILPMNMHKSTRVQQTCEKVYDQLIGMQVDTLLDDRKIRPGVMFADMELLGIPHFLIVGERGIDENYVEYQSRKDQKKVKLAISEIRDFIQQQLSQ